jgi:signal transduction histidine kinase
MKKYATIWFVFSIFITNANIETDSSKIVTYFGSALQNQNYKDSLTKQAELIYQNNYNDTLIQDTYLFNLAKYLYQTAQLDSAYKITLKGQALYKNQPLAYKNGKFHNILGSIYAYQKKYDSAIEEYNKAIRVFDQNNDPYQAALIKNNIANIFFSLLDYESAYKYSKESYSYLNSINDTLYLPSLISVTAISALELNYLEEGFELAIKGLKLSQTYSNVLGLILGNYALGEYYLKSKKYEEAIDYFKQSLELCETYQLTQYSLLNQVGLLIVNEEKGDFKTAVDYGELVLKNAKLLNNKEIQYSINKHIGRAYAGLNNYQKAFYHINMAHEMYLETSNTETKKAINDLLIKYETEKKEKELIEKDLLLIKEELKFNKQTTWMIGLVTFLTSVLIFYLVFAKQQKKKRKKQQETAQLLALIEGEEKERQRVSDELHDGVASSISGIKIKLEHLIQQPNQEELLNLTKQLSKLHEETRRISHNLIPASLKYDSLISVLKTYCYENSNPYFKINFFDATSKNVIVENNVKNVLYRVVQELINNVQKHAKSDTCFVQLSNTDKEFTISIEDEGIGFELDSKNGGQGLKSIKNRIEKLGGSLLIESKTAKGTIVIIQIPIK